MVGMVLPIGLCCDHVILYCYSYDEVEVTNFQNSWKNGMAFCAVIDRHRYHVCVYVLLCVSMCYSVCLCYLCYSVTVYVTLCVRVCTVCECTRAFVCVTVYVCLSVCVYSGL